MNRRGAIITDSMQAFAAIVTGKSLILVTTTMCVGQLRQRSVAWIVEQVKLRRLYHKVAPVSAAVTRYIRYERMIKDGFPSYTLDYIIRISADCRHSAAQPTHTPAPDRASVLQAEMDSITEEEWACGEQQLD